MDIADGVKRKLDDKYIVAERLTGWITFAVFAILIIAGLVVLHLVASMPAWVWILIYVSGGLVLLALGLSAHYWPGLYYRRLYFRVDSAGIEIKRGVIWRKVISVPRSRVQHTDVLQGPIERRFGLATLTIHTAGTADSSVRLGGLNHETASSIRDFLIAESGNDAV